jgi:hypothetical protein
MARAPALNPLGCKNRPDHAIALAVTLPETPGHDGFACRAEFPEERVAARVLNGRASFEAKHAWPSKNLIDEKPVQEQLCGAHCDATPPVGLANGKSPFGRRKLAIGPPELDDADRMVGITRHDPVARVGSPAPLRVRPSDEPLESINSRRALRDVLKHGRTVDMSKQPQRIMTAKLPQ